MRFLHIIFLVFSILVSAQQKTNMDEIRSKYESFEYKDVITLSEKCLTLKDSVSRQDLMEIYMMKAVSHYALTEIPQVRKCFIEMLKIDNNFEPDSDIVSPKIVNLFDEVKNDFMQTRTEHQIVISSELDSLRLADNEAFLNRLSLQRNTLLRSLVFPGWGPSL